ncbi:hypothetical protein TNCV_2970001 [Trichonephila clavipes]|nr:hypothetical protein TNCV_2970001 [Trichonephila clavipes]
MTGTLTAAEKRPKPDTGQHFSAAAYGNQTTGAIVPDFIFVEDNAHSQRTSVAEALLESECIYRMDWSACFSALNSLEHGYVKSLVYADKPQTLDHLEDNIRRVIADTRPQMLEKVIENWTSRLDYIRASRGSHMPEIIFKM